MKLIEAKQPKTNRVRVLIQQMTDTGQPVGSKGGLYEKNKQISLYETTVSEVYQLCLEALRREQEGGEQ